MYLNMEFWNNLSIYLFYTFNSIICVFLMLFILLLVSEEFNKLWFSWVYTECFTEAIKRGGDAIRARLFEKLSSIKSTDSAEQMSILEIGPARGNNFEFYPPNCRITALDCNSYFEKYFHAHKSEFPHIVCDKYVNGMAEDMKEIEDNSVDVVVATNVLCSVTDINRSLKEIQRVLKRGGTYFFMEHVGYPHTSKTNIALYFIQLLLLPIWYPMTAGCHLHRQPWTHLEKAGFQTLNLNYEYPKEMYLLLRAQIWGTATKHE